MGLILEESVVHLPELTLRPSRQRRFMREQRVGIRPRRHVLEDHADVASLLEQPVDDARRPRAGERFEVGEDEDGNGSFVGTTDGGYWMSWLRRRRWSGLTTWLAGLRRGDVRRGDKQERG